MKRFISNLVIFIIFIGLVAAVRSTDPKKFDGAAKNLYIGIKNGISDIYEKGASLFNDILISYGSPQTIGTDSKAPPNTDGGISSAIINNVKAKILSASGMPSSKYTVSSHKEYYNVILTSLNNYDKSVTIRLNNYDENTYRLETVKDVINDHFDRDYHVKSIESTIYAGNRFHAITITFDYAFDRDKMIKMQSASDAKAKEIISKVIKPGMSDIQKELAIHDYIVKNTSYDFNNLIRGTLPEESYTLYGALINNRAVCEGYAKAMFRLLNMAGVENRVVLGEADGVAHAWNLVKIDGKYTHLDATWDDPVTGTNEGVLSHEYFNVSDKKISKTHKWDTSKYPKGVAIPLK